MPQLDTLSFTTQVFWFLLVYVVFYFVIAYVYLPRLTGILTLRADSYDVINKMSAEAKYLKLCYSNYLLLSFSEELITGTKTRLLDLLAQKQSERVLAGLESTYRSKTMATKYYVVAK
jgi:Plant ATP synthase F0